MSVITRFAPSPTGKIHVGNLRPAIINWLFARHMGGQFMLRIDDTDQERSTKAYEEGIREDLTWLGLNWDLEARQSERFDRYDEVVEGLKSRGLLYACYETADELERKRRRQLAQGLPPVYDRSSLNLTSEQISAYKQEGRTPHWRFKLEERTVEWQDLVRGEQTINAGSLSDPVLIRHDGTYLYTLPSVIDDIDFGISHVIRGEDHVANTGAQIQIFEALGAMPPIFAHHNLLVGKEGEALSKRLGSLSIATFRDEGIEPMALLSHAATIGTSEPIAAHQQAESLAKQFGFEKLSRSPARFDPDELALLNSKLLHDTPYERVKDRLAELEVGGGAVFWDCAKANIEKFSDVVNWWQIVIGPITPEIEDSDFALEALELLPPEPFDDRSWGLWTKAVSSKTGAKGKSLFKPLRLALTGLEYGPELKALLPLIGHEKASKRLQGQKA